MKVYIEVVILDNLLMTAAISRMSYFVLGIKKCWFRTAIAAVVGTAISVCYPFMPLSDWLLILFKLAVGIGLSFILFVGVHGGKNKLLRGGLIFFLMTALAGGMCVLINYLIAENFHLSVVTAPVMPYCVCSVAVCLLAFAFKLLWSSAKKRRAVSSFEYDVTLFAFGSRFTLRGFLDSGNTLYDPDSGLPVVIVKLKAIERKLDAETIVLLLSGRADKIAGVKYLATDSLAGHSELAVTRPEKIELYFDGQLNTNINVMLGVSVGDFGGNADLLLHPAVCGG